MAKTPPAPIEEDDDEPVEFAPDNTLKEKIGMNMSEILTPEVVKSSQEVIDKSQQDFLKWVADDLDALETAYQALRAEPETGRHAALEIQKLAFSCKAQAGTFGFNLGSAVAKSLYDFLEKDYVEGEPGHTIIIRKHIDTLRTIFRRSIKGDGGKIGQAVYSALGKLIRKFDV